MRYLITALIAAACAAAIVTPAAMAAGVKTASLADTKATLIIGLIGACITLVAAMIAIWGVYTQRAITRRQTTVQHLFALKADACTQANRTKLIEAARGNQNLAKWADEDAIGSPETLAIIAVLNDYELLSTGIQAGIYDFSIVKKYDASTIKKTWKNTLPFVAALRNRTDIGTLWKEFELLHCWVEGSRNPTMTLFIKGLA